MASTDGGDLLAAQGLLEAFSDGIQAVMHKPLHRMEVRMVFRDGEVITCKGAEIDDVYETDDLPRPRYDGGWPCAGH